MTIKENGPLENDAGAWYVMGPLLGDVILISVDFDKLLFLME